MQQATAPNSGGEMSWARAIVLATGFFFLAALYLGQWPSFFLLASTNATLDRFSQALLTVGLLALGMGLVGIVAAFLYDPKPVSRLFIGLFALLGLGLMAAGAGLMVFVLLSGHNFLPDQTVIAGKPPTIINWPDPSKAYLFNPIWFQPRSINIDGVGFVLLMTGGGIFGYAALYPLHVAGRLSGALRSALVQFSVGGAGALLLAYLTLYTFAPNLTVNTWANGGLYNIVLALALILVVFAIQVWLLPVMTAPRNRERFMPAMYLHAIMLIGNVAVPLLVVFVVLYPLVNLLALNDTTLNFHGYFVSCSQKTNIPGSCTFTGYFGYLIAGVVSGMFFTFLLIGGYLWNKKPAFVRLGSLYAILFAALATVAVHTDPTQLPIALSLSIGMAILGLVWVVATQREFVPASAMAAPLGCVGQWLVMGTTLAIYIAAFAFFSYPQWSPETEGNLIINPGLNTIHDAYWMMLIFGALAAIQFTFLVRRRAMGTLRKATLWLVFIGAALEIGASIHFNLGDPNNLVNPVFYVGLVVEVAGILVGAWGAFQTRAQGGLAWLVLTVATIVVGGVAALFVLVSGSALYELVVAFSILMATGAVIYSIMGADAPDTFLARLTRGTNADVAAMPQGPSGLEE